VAENAERRRIDCQMPPVNDRKPIHRAAKTRPNCPCENSAMFPLTPIRCSISRSARFETSLGVSPRGHPSAKLPVWSAFPNVHREPSFVIAVVPFLQIRLNLGCRPQPANSHVCRARRLALVKIRANVICARRAQVGAPSPRHAQSTECPCGRYAGPRSTTWFRHVE